MDDSLLAALVRREPRAIARALTIVVDELPSARTLLATLHDATGHATIVGVTGPPGVGKSTLVDRLVGAIRATGRTVAVLAVDPTSPFTGGALLGDRVRMQTHASDPGVLIRSLATRGDLGGVPATVADAASVLDAAGFDMIVVETVGVGQDEVEVARLADVTVVVLAPGGGDEIQSLKAGLMEVADVFVVNKADLPGAGGMVAAVQASLSLGPPREDGWTPPVQRTIGTDGTGVAELAAVIARYADESRPDRETRRQRRARPRTDATGPSTAAVELDHTAVAVSDPRALLAFLDALGVATGEPEEVTGQSVRVRFAATGPAAIEIVEPSGPASPIDGFLRRRGPGLHHVALRVPDLAECLRRLEARGVPLIDRVPRPGAHGCAVAFVHPTGTGGVLVELMEKERAREDR